MYLCIEFERTIMNITTDNEALVDLIQHGKTKDKRYRDLPKGVVKGFLKAYDILKREERVEGLFKYKSLNYERLTNTNKESVRCNDKYRLMFHSSAKENSIILTEIELLEITNHYGKI